MGVNILSGVLSDFVFPTTIGELRDLANVTTQSAFASHFEAPLLLLTQRPCNEKLSASATNSRTPSLSSRPAANRSCRQAAHSNPEAVRLRPPLANQTFEVLLLQSRAQSLYSERITMGRSIATDIVVGDASISLLHAHFFRRHDGVYLVHTDADNVTTWRGAALTVNAPVRLSNGDEVGFGSLLFRFGDARWAWDESMLALATANRRAG